MMNVDQGPITSNEALARLVPNVHMTVLGDLLSEPPSAFTRNSNLC
jgi:hypothetical protein